MDASSGETSIHSRVRKIIMAERMNASSMMESIMAKVVEVGIRIKSKVK